MTKVPYQKECRIRMVGAGGVEATIPRVIVERAARAEGQTIPEFVKSHRLIYLFNDFHDYDGAFRFQRTEGNGGKIIEVKEADTNCLSFDDLRRKIRRVQ